MGLPSIKNIQKKLGDFTKSAIEKGTDAVTAAGQFSPSQLAAIDKKHREYLSKKPEMDGEEIQNRIKRNLDAIGIEVFHSYIPRLRDIYAPIGWDYGNFASGNRIRYFDITKWVLDSGENSLDKLVNVYHVLNGEECSIALIYHREPKKCTVTLAVVNNGDISDSAIANDYGKRVINAIKGNFPGTTLSVGDDSRSGGNSGIPPYINSQSQQTNSVAVISNIASEKSEKFISQSMEKLLDGIVPKDDRESYTLVLLAASVKEQIEKKNRLYELYTALSPYESWQTNFQVTDFDNISAGAAVGVNLGASAGAQAGASASVGASISDGTSHSTSDTKGNTTGKNASFNIPHTGIGVGAHHEKSHSITEGNSTSLTNTASANAGANAGVHAGVSAGFSFTRNANVSAQIGKSEGITQNYKNFGVAHALEIIKTQMQRLEQSAALGMWNFAAYAISEDPNIANNVAHMYLALTQGENSYLAQSGVNLWHGSNQREACECILSSLNHLQHPEFGLRAGNSDDNELLIYPAVVDATTAVSGKELAYSMNFPRRSIAGLPVLECAEFGRNITSYDNIEIDEQFKIGNIYHMHHKEKTPVELRKKSLASHAFITGSTGAGKSNTVYKILDEAMSKKVNFLVIEPAKGEYKNVFGNLDNVSVYGTNPKITPLLKIDPFSFPGEIHVLEHLDRLIEIFNVCWPMYAAMPAVLKNAVEKAYEDCGWDLTESTNEFGEDLYPNFADVARNVKLIIDSSEYDTENKGAYKGSLLTRLNSLTNGINGLIFNSDEISMEELFDKNVVVDLSRVGSMETKSLIMGMLVLKLQEHRMSNGETNAKLRHLTVLEEAHNLLRRTSTEQPAEGGNLLGKSVEMLANAIAEMRTYGEGFIIADQAPELLDMSVIRNTNTKIIMRLPDQSDRELVGKAANLNENQIAELAKLPCGVAAVYQNEWIQPVLCKVEEFKHSNEKFKYTEPKCADTANIGGKCVKIAELLSSGTTMSCEAILSEINPILQEMNVSSSVRAAIFKLLQNPPKEPRMTKLAPIMSALFPKVRRAVERSYSDSREPMEWTAAAKAALQSSVNESLQEQVRRDIIQAIITDYVYNALNNIDDVEHWTKEGLV